MTIHAGDSINACFELFGCYAQWCNVIRLRHDRQVKGVVWQYTAVWIAWGIFNIWYYPSIGQSVSFIAGMGMCLANIVWLILAICVSVKR